jgi:energy-coupling factor transporter ATP-binding protein EcfA2
VVKSYTTPSGSFTALKGTSLQAQAGEFVAIVGKSGSGKSTLINLTAGIDRPSSGAIDNAGTPVHNGAPQAVAISGVVYDPSLAPAWQEREGYAYITPATLTRLGEPGTLGELKIVVAGAPYDQTTVDRTTRELGAWLRQQGHAVRELQIPPAGMHPHQNQMTWALLMLLSLSLLALMLSAILVATVIAGLLAQQIRQIGAMKTIGARTRQIAGQGQDYQPRGYSGRSRIARLLAVSRLYS